MSGLGFPLTIQDLVTYWLVNSLNDLQLEALDEAVNAVIVHYPAMGAIPD